MNSKEILLGSGAPPAGTSYAQAEKLNKELRRYNYT